MKKVSSLISVVSLALVMSGAAIAHQEHGHHSHAHSHSEAQAESQFVRAEVIEIDVDHHELVLRHEPIDHLNMGAMTMAFSVSEDLDIDHLNEGEEIKVKVERKDRDFVVVAMKSAQHAH